MSVSLKRFENTKIPPFCLEFCFSYNQLQRGWKNWGKIAIPMKSEARQKNFQQIGAFEPYAILPVYIKWSVCSFLVQSYREFEARQDQCMGELQKSYRKQMNDILIWLYPSRDRRGVAS